MITIQEKDSIDGKTRKKNVQLYYRMREDIKLKQYRILHKRVGEIYCNDFKNVKDSCSDVGITPSKYYKICKTLGKRSVGAPKGGEKKAKGGSKTRRPEEKRQRGGANGNEKGTENGEFEMEPRCYGTDMQANEHQKQSSGDRRLTIKLKNRSDRYTNEQDTDSGAIISGTAEEISTKIRNLNR